MDTKQLIKEELKRYLMKRFNLTDKQATKVMKKREDYGKDKLGRGK